MLPHRLSQLAARRLLEHLRALELVLEGPVAILEDLDLAVDQHIVQPRRVARLFCRVAVPQHLLQLVPADIRDAEPVR